MAGIKITELTQADAMSAEASFVITQLETVGSSQVESVRRAGMEATVTALKDAGVNDGCVSIDGTDEVTPKNLQIMDKVISPNLIDTSKITDGKYITADGVEHTGDYFFTDYIPVEAGAQYCGTVLFTSATTGATILYPLIIRWLACYDNDKNIMVSAGSDTEIATYPYTIPDGVSYVRLSMNNSASYSQHQFEKGEESTTYHPYGELLSAVIKTEYIPDAIYKDMVHKDGVGEVTPQNLQIVDATISPNLINEAEITDGKYIQKNGSEYDGDYKVTDYIPVEAGGKYCFTWLYGGNRIGASLRFFACYDSSKAVIPSAGSDTMITTYPITIAADVAYVRLSFSRNTAFTKYQFEKGETPTEYHAYNELLEASIKEQYLPDNLISRVVAFHLVDGQNLWNANDPDLAAGKFLYTYGTLSDNADYATSGYIPVSKGDRLVGSYKKTTGAGKASFRTVAAYDSSKAVITASGSYLVDDYIVPDNVAYVRICVSSSSYGPNIQIQKLAADESYYPYEEYEAPHYELDPDYMYQNPAHPVHVFLPKDIYVAVGRTIELYNEQIVLDYEKYHFRWVCGKGAAYKRKFSITGETVGNSTLSLELYDDKGNMCWRGESTIHVVSASNPVKKILPIGDSLTNWKAWLQETILLSSNNITFVGTRYSGQSVDSEGNVYSSGTIHHEGRSGWSAENYLANTEYTFDNLYDGVAGVDGTANPFWDGTKFSLEHYLTTQTGVPTPDAVQIFLGTNDLTVSVESAVENITAMVTSIRSEYPNLPIFVCNTIFRSNQNGYGSTGNDAYAGGAGASAWQYEQDARVMDLMVGLRTSLANVTSVYFIPLASCMDREYDFGQVMTKVNPRSSVEIPMPKESVHPLDVGYYQMADLMYSFYCGILS